MRVLVQVTNTDDLEVDITLRMSLGDARRLAAQLGSQYPSWRLGGAITRAVNAAGQVFDAELAREPQP